MPIQFGSSKHEQSVSLLKKLLESGSYNYVLDSTSAHNIPGQARGILTGGNLALVCDSLGTSNEIETDNRVLFLEDIGEDIYQIDRMLNQLKRAGKLDNIKGLIMGQFTDIRDTNPSFGMDLQEMILPLIPSNIPVVFDFPAGHEAPNYPLVINGEHELIIDDKVTLNYPG